MKESDRAFPPAFEQRMQTQLSNEWASFLEAHRTPAPISIRLNPAKPINIESKAIPWTQTGRFLERRPSFTLDPLFHAGAYYVQEASSMFLEQAFMQTVTPGTSLRVLDLSAAPGGKSTHLLSLLNGRGLLVSNEVIQSRATILSENIQKWGYANVLVTNNDPSAFSHIHDFFDVIVVDAPCSGEGLFRKDPDAMREWSPGNVDLCAARQTRILHDIWPALKENGILIYSTCTYNEKENEDNLISFTREHGAESMTLNIEDTWGVMEVRKENITGYRFYPHKVNGEGFFISVLRKKEASDRSHGKTKKRLVHAPKNVKDKLTPWIDPRFSVQLYQHNDLIFALPTDLEHDFDFLLQYLKLIYAGTNVATLKHEKAIPEHALAVSLLLHRAAFNNVEIDLDAALEYLRRNTISLENQPKGYSLLTFQNVPIGWVNVLENRVNNLYPQEWRIRMGR